LLARLAFIATKKANQMCPFQKINRIKLLAVIFCLWASVTFAQSSYLTISGQVLNHEDGKPLPYVSISIIGRSLGTTSNAQGNFVFKVPSEYHPDSLRISCLGFQSFTQAIATLPQQSIVVRLQPAIMLLEEVQVQAQAKSAVDILKEAVAAIPLNYETASVQMTAFYREDGRLEDEPVSFIEAVLSINKSPYGNKEANDEVRIIKGRKKPMDQSRDNTIKGYLNLGNGSRTALYGDFVKYALHKNSMLNEKNFKNYDFKILGLVNDDNRKTYVMEILPKKNKKKAYFTGKIYLDAQTLAFTRAECQSTPEGIALENSRHWILKKFAALVSKMTVNLADFQEVVTFHPYQGKWYLSSVERRLGLVANSPSRGIENKKWRVSISFTTTDIGPKNVYPFAEGDINQSWNTFNNLIGDQYDAAFWENYNIQQPTAADTIFEKKMPVQAVPKSGAITPKAANQNNGS
jgi:hypothetical protein